MKNIFTSFLILFVFMTVSGNANAAEDRQPKTVSGKVKNADLSVAKNVPVSITCKTTTLTKNTTVNGNYSVTFGNLECEQFDTVNVNSSDGSNTGNASKVATFALSVTMPDIILQAAEGSPTPTDPTPTSISEPSPTDVQPSTVPEWGMIGGIVAATGSMLTYVKIRRKV